jgi:tRNA pseudouridine38-40 synthase
MRILLTVEYLGTRYSGWQAQANATGVQQVIEGVLTTVFGEAVRIEGAGRTDSGVHARAQRAHADVPFTLPRKAFLRGCNDLLPSDIRIIDAREVADTFHCRFAPHTKTYEYRIWNGEVANVFRHETHVHVAQKLDENLMHRVAQVLIGEHDFRAFTVASPEVSSTVRRITEIAVARRGDTVTISVTADGFLRYMVRRIAGSLVEIGRGKLDGDALARSLEPAFEAARWTAPAKGLCLLRVDYEMTGSSPSTG